MNVTLSDSAQVVFLAQVSFFTEIALLAWLREQERRRWRFAVISERLGLGSWRYTLPMWAAKKLSYRGAVDTGYRQPGDTGGGSQRWVTLR